MTAAADLRDLRGLNNNMWTLGKGAWRERSFGGDASTHEMAASACSKLPIQTQLQHLTPSSEDKQGLKS